MIYLWFVTITLLVFCWLWGWFCGGGLVVAGFEGYD